VLLHPLAFDYVFLHYLKNKHDRIKGAVPGGTFTVLFVWQDAVREAYSETALPRPAPGAALRKSRFLVGLRGGEGKGKGN